MKNLHQTIYTRIFVFGLLTLLVGLLVTQVGGVKTAVSAPSSTQTTVTNPENAELYLPILLNRFDGSLGLPVFGVQMYGNTRPNSPYYTALIDSGATWVRIPIIWGEVEPERLTPKQYNWASVDRALAAARADYGNLQIIGTIYYAPDWASPDHPRAVLYDHALPDLAQFVKALAERYNGNGINDAPGSPVVTHWEFYNEPDITTEPGGVPLWGDHGDKYAQMLSHVYPAVKAGNPQAQVVFGGIAYDAFTDEGGTFVREFLDEVLTAGGGNYFDIMNFHAYPVFSSQWTGKGTDGGPGLLEKATFIRHKLQNEYGLNKPMIITEAGWFSDNPPNLPSSPEVQSRYVVQLFTQSLAADIDVMIWWMLHDPGIGYNSTGLVTNDTPPVRKPSFYVYQNMAKEMSTTHFERKLSPAETGNPKLEVYRFNDLVKQRTLYIAWLNPVNTIESQPLLITAPQVTVKSMEGAILYTIQDGDDNIHDGRVTVDVGGRPIYIEVNH